MPYIDAIYYTDEYEGVEIDASEINRYIKRASDVIDEITGYKIQDFESLPSWMQDLVKKATAAQVEFFALEGGPEVVTGSNDMQSVNIGSFSYQQGSGDSSTSVSPAVFDYLRTTGLLYRGIGVVENAYYQTDS